MKERPSDIGAVKEGWPLPEAGSAEDAQVTPVWNEELGVGPEGRHPRRDSYDLFSVTSDEPEVLARGLRQSCVTESEPVHAGYPPTGANPAPGLVNLGGRQPQENNFSASNVKQLFDAGWVSSNRLGPKDTSRDDMDATVQLMQSVCGVDPLRGHSVARKRLLGYLSHRLFMKEQCRQLPLAICFFVVLVLLMTQHLDLHTVKELSGAVERSMALQEPAPTGFSALWTQVSRRAEAALAVPNTRVLGGVRVARLLEGQSGPSEVLCGYNLGNFVWDSVRSDRSSRPSTCSDRSAEFAWVHWPMKREAAELTLAQTRSGWEASSAGLSGLAVQMISINDKVHVYTLYSHAAHFDLSGFMINEMRVDSFDARPKWLNMTEDWASSGKGVMLVDISFCVLLVIFAGLGLLSCCWDCRTKGRSATLESSCDAWLVVSLLMFCMGLMTVISYSYCNFLVDGLNTVVAELPTLDMQKRYSQLALKSLVSTGAASGDDRWSSYEQLLNALLEQAQRVHEAQTDLRCYAAVVMICACLRLLRALRGTSRLDFFVGTIWKAAEDLAHLLLMLSAVLLVFLLAGHLIFGGRVEVFSSGSRALESTVLFLFGFMFDTVHKNIGDFGGGLGIAWLWLFNIATVLLLLNMAVAMVLHAYIGEEAGLSRPASLIQDVRNWLNGQAVGELKLLHSSHAEALAECSAAEKAVKKFSEKRVYQALEEHGAHPDPRVTSTSLTFALAGQSGVEWRRMDRLVTHAAEGSADTVEQQSLLTGSVRVCRRMDANVRELGNCVAALALAADMVEACGIRESIADWRAPLGSESVGSTYDFSLGQPPQPPQALALQPALSARCTCGRIFEPDEVYCKNCLARRTEALQLEDVESSQEERALVTQMPPKPPGPAELAEPDPPEQQPLSLAGPAAPLDEEVEAVLALEPAQAAITGRPGTAGSEDEDEVAPLALPEDVEPPFMSKMGFVRTLPLVSAMDAVNQRQSTVLEEQVHNLELSFEPVLEQASRDLHPKELPNRSSPQLHGIEDSVQHLEDTLNKFADSC